MTTKQSWEEKFDEEFDRRNITFALDPTHRHIIKTFISQLLAEERAKVVEEMVEKLPVIEIKEDVAKGYFQLRYKIGDMIADTVLLENDMSTHSAIDVSLKVIKAANDAWQYLKELN